MTNVLFSPIDSLQVASYIIKQCNERDIFLNVTKLQKLMYCCYGTVLAKYGERLTNEYPEAWPYGPVFPTVLRSIQFFGLLPFSNKPTPDIANIPAEIIQLINQTLESFGDFTANQLSQWSHKKDSPWYRASNNGKLLYTRLSDKDIQSYFAEKVLR